MSGMKLIVDVSGGPDNVVESLEPLSEQDIQQQAVDHAAWEAAMSAPPVESAADKIASLEAAVASLQALVTSLSSKGNV